MDERNSRLLFSSFSPYYFHFIPDIFHLQDGLFPFICTKISLSFDRMVIRGQVILLPHMLVPLYVNLAVFLEISPSPSIPFAVDV